MESLTTGPELENSQVHSATCRTVWAMSVFALRVQPVSATPLVVYRLAFGSPRSFAGVD